MNGAERAAGFGGHDGAASGPLVGVRVVDLSRLAPGPYCSMLLADMGADVIRVDPPGDVPMLTPDPLGRGKRSIVLDLKVAADRDVLHGLVDRADVVLEGFRPGVADRLGAGYRELSARNPQLVYCSITGWGQTGPLAQVPGHDIDFIAIAGALEPIGRAGERPVPPLNVLGDFAGGGLMAAFGIATALFERERSGVGQYIDAAMLDGALSLMAQHYGFVALGMEPGRGRGVVDTGAPFYEVYETSDGGFMCVGAIEPHFFAEFCALVGVTPPAQQMGRSAWPALRGDLTAAFASRTRSEWEAVFAGSNACVQPVLRMSEAVEHPHNVARGAFVDVDGHAWPAPAPRLGRTPGAVRSSSPAVGEHSEQIRRWLAADAPEISPEPHAAVDDTALEDITT